MGTNDEETKGQCETRWGDWVGTREVENSQLAGKSSCFEKRWIPETFQTPPRLESIVISIQSQFFPHLFTEPMGRPPGRVPPPPVTSPQLLKLNKPGCPVTIVQLRVVNVLLLATR